MATNIQNWRNVANNLKISQLLDMYYSDRGVFDKTVRACQRQDKFNTIAPANTLLQEVIKKYLSVQIYYSYLYNF